MDPVILSTMKGRKLGRFLTILHRAKFESAHEVEIREEGNWLYVKWRFGPWWREVALGKNGGIRQCDREWWEEQVGMEYPV